MPHFGVTERCLERAFRQGEGRRHGRSATEASSELRMHAVADFLARVAVRAMSVGSGEDGAKIGAVAQDQETVARRDLARRAQIANGFERAERRPYRVAAARPNALYRGVGGGL